MPYATTAAMRRIIERLRARGVQVTEVAGWESRGHAAMGKISGVVCHHTAGAKTGDYPSLAIVRDGRPGLAGPLAQWGVGRSGAVYVIAAGLAYHAGATNDPLFTNSHAYGIEAENTGTGEPWSEALLRSYAALCAEIRHEYGLGSDQVRGHKEICSPAGRKIDPAGIDMNQFRARVDRALEDQEDDMTPAQEKMLQAIYDTLTPGVQGVKFDGAVYANARDAKAAAQDAPRGVWAYELGGAPAWAALLRTGDAASLAAQLKPAIAEALAGAKGATADEVATKVADALSKRLAA